MRDDLAANPHALTLLDYPTSDMFIGPVVVVACAREGRTIGLAGAVVASVTTYLTALGVSELPSCDVTGAAAQQHAVRQERVAAGYSGHGYQPYARVISLGADGELVGDGDGGDMDI